VVPEAVPPPTIFPFADGLDDAGLGGPAEPATAAGFHGEAPWAESSAPAAAPESPWSPAAPDDAAEQALWPSSWPADQPPDELPSWAVPPNDRDTGGAAPLGGDGRSFGDLPPANGNGTGDGNGLSSLAAGPAGSFLSPGLSGDRPPELDELPAWYTDPLPNERGERGANGAGSPPPVPGGASAETSWSPPAPGPDSLWPATAPEGDALWPASPPANGDVLWPAPSGHGQAGGWAAPPDEGAAGSEPVAEHAGPVNGYHDGPPDAAGRSDTPQLDRAAVPEDERLPGAGDELRSLFGEVVRDPADPPAARGPAANGAPSSPRGRVAPDTDPLGPPSDRPPIDLSRLDTPLGPAPYLPANRDADGEGGDRAARLPRRHEVPTRPGGDGHDAGSPPARLPRADEAHPSGGRADEEAARPDRSVPRQVAPDPERTSRAAAAASAGPPALPVIILVAVVAVLLLGVAWLVITGDEAEAPASDRPSADAADDTSDEGGGAGAAAGAAGAPTGVAVAPVPEGIQVTWTGAPDGSYVVTVLAPDQPPRALAPTVGTSVLVPNAEITSGGGRCFTVATAPDAAGAPGTPSAPACTPDATVEGMQQAAPPA
jgi:hypothetical protein